jgi:hypothetical protein
VPNETVFQIEQFIDTLFPKVDPKALSAADKTQDKPKEAGMDTSETLVFMGVAVLFLLIISLLMV